MVDPCRFHVYWAERLLMKAATREEGFKGNGSVLLFPLVVCMF